MYQVFPYTILEVDTLHIAMTIVIATKQMEQKMKGQVLAVDFEKRELEDTQHKSENDKHGRKGGLATIGRKRIDYMSDEHIREAMLNEGYVKTFEQRTRRKQSIRTNTHKLLNKAQANIEAEEKGTFGVGH